jgi:hypothetical protein
MLMRGKLEVKRSPVLKGWHVMWTVRSICLVILIGAHTTDLGRAGGIPPSQVRVRQYMTQVEQIAAKELNYFVLSNVLPQWNVELGNVKIIATFDSDLTQVLGFCPSLRERSTTEK